MLVLSRKPGQALLVGGEIVVKVVEIRGQQVRIGIDAPDSVAIVRQELHDQVEDANRAAASRGSKNASRLASRMRRDERKENQE
ncbi:MAG: carbon storage regulator CsrA [Acidobacteriota bacterium]|nr:MAG: carbon storage regulator [Acidobacteriota bacterium]